MPHVADWKKEKVAELEELTNNNEIIGIVNLADIPAPQLQTMRRTLGDKAILKMSRKNFIKIALANSNKDVEGLADYLEGQPAMVFTEMNPFKLFKILEDSKTEAPAKAGAIAPADIVVPAGDTSFPPGPILGELQQAGIPAKIDKGSIVVQEDATVVKEGEPVPKNVADILTKLEIYPMEVGMDLLAVCEGDTIYTADVLKIDEEETLQTIATAYQNAINLSVNAGIVNSESHTSISSSSFAILMRSSLIFGFSTMVFDAESELNSFSFSTILSKMMVSKSKAGRPPTPSQPSSVCTLRLQTKYLPILVLDFLTVKA